VPADTGARSPLQAPAAPIVSRPKLLGPPPQATAFKQRSLERQQRRLQLDLSQSRLDKRKNHGSSTQKMARNESSPFLSKR